MMSLATQPAVQLFSQYQSFSWQDSVVNPEPLFNAVAEAFSSLSAQQQYQISFSFGGVSLMAGRHSEANLPGQVDLQIEAGVMANGHNALRLPERHLVPADAMDVFCVHLATALCSVGSDYGQAQRMSSRAKCALIPGSNPDSLAKVSAIIAAMLNDIAMKVMPTTNVAQATERAQYANVIREIQQRGIPCDVELLAAVRTDHAALWQSITNYYDPMQTVYRNGRFDHSAFAQLIDSQGIDFPLQASGKPNLDDFKDMAKAYPVLTPIYSLYKLDAQLRNEKLVLNAENRLIADLKPFATVTGRHAPSSNKFVLGLSKQFRDLVTPEPGTALFMLDFVGQEIAIAAVQSGDQLLQQDYLNGDVYLTFAKHIALVPESATKATHAAERELSKMIFIGVLYGMGAQTLATKLNCDDAKARQILIEHRQRYPQLWQWQEALLQQAREQQELSTASGWRVFVDYSTKPTSIKNWLIQAVGADILRKAILDCESAGLRVLAPLHDAILFESSLVDLDAHVQQAKTLMINAAKHWLSDFPLRLDTQLVFPGQTLCPTNVTGLKHFVGATSQNLEGDFYGK
jgi:hypothetical protein